MSHNGPIDFTLTQLMETWVELSKCISQHPEKLMRSQSAYWENYTKLYQELDIKMEPSQSNKNYFDKRFTYKDWQGNVSFNFIKRSYLLLSQHINHLINDVTENSDVKIRNKIQFYTRQMIDALSPSNFAHINPEILSKTLETDGKNLMLGMKQFLEDLEKSKGQLNIKSTDLTSFKLGESIACTPGKIIYQNDLMQLIQYTATTKEIYQYPLLITPPWINKYYILDLQQENSLVKWLVDQGFTVFMISWVNPTEIHKEKQFSDYMVEGPLVALKVIEQVTKAAKTNVLGYCIGGTLLGCMLAYLAKKTSVRINSATFLTTLFDFSEPGELGTFIDENQISFLEKQMEETGYLDGNIMATVFNALRANDLIWSAFIKNYLKGEKPRPFDLLFWNADSTNIPAPVHSFYLRNMYLKNSLIEPNKVKLAGVTLDLNTINVPSYFLAAQDDHIVPWQSSYKSSQFYNGKVKFVLTTSGHVAGVINPPHKNKYGYWTNNRNPNKPEKYLSSAIFKQGSWWDDWVLWLKKYSGKIQSIDYLNTAKQYVIENAPGTYVKVRLSEIETDKINS